MQRSTAFALLILTAMAVCHAQSNAVNLTFEGLQNGEPILDYYNGGRGGLKSGPGPNYGITFGSGALAIIGIPQGGGGNFEGNPSGKTIAFFLAQGGLVMNVAAGFRGGFSFYYAATPAAGKVTVYDDVNASGNVLATIDLPVTGANCGGSEYGYSCWKVQGVTFDGAAKSVNFGGSADQIGFDDITLGSATPLPAPPPVITTTSVLNGTLGVPYTTVVGATGGTPPYQWVANGLPGGLVIDKNTAVVTGTPTTSGGAAVAVQLTDAKGLTASQTLQFVIAASSPQVTVSPTALSFASNVGGDLPPAQNVAVTIASTASSPFTVKMDDGAGGPAPTWLAVSASAGATPGLVQVSIAPNNFPKGVYHARLRISGPVLTAGVTPVDVAITYTVSAGAPQVTAAPSMLRFLARAIAPGTFTQSFLLRNPGGGGPLAVTASAATSSSFITKVVASPATIQANAPVEVDVTIDTHSLTAGSYTNAVHVTTPAGAFDVPVTVLVAAPGAFMSDSLSGVRFITRQGSKVSANQSVDVRNLGDPGTMVNWSAKVIRGADLVALSPPTGTSIPGVPASFGVNLTPAATNAIGTKSALIQVSDPKAQNSPQYFVAVADVADPKGAPVPDPDPSGLAIIYVPGVPAANQPQTISVNTNSVAPVLFSVSTSASDGGTWLRATPSSAMTSQSAPASVAVSIGDNTLTAGVYTGLVNISIGDVVRSVGVTVDVYNLAGSARIAEGLMRTRSASCNPQSLVVSQTGLVNNFAVPASYPRSIAVQVADNCLNPITNATVVASFSNGDAPLLLATDPTVPTNTAPTGQTAGLYTATWQPGAAVQGMTVTIDAIAGSLQAGRIVVGGGVQTNPSPAPSLAPGGFLNNLNPRVGAALAPGTVTAVYGDNMAAAADSPKALPLPGALDTVEALVGGLDSPLYYVSKNQLTVEVPAELAPNRTYSALLVAGDQYSLPQNVDLNAVAPGTVAFPDGRLVAQHADFTLVDATHPAAPGEALVIYLVGMGATSPTVVSGVASPGSPLAGATASVTMTVDTQPVTIAFAGLTPGGVGLYQINFAVPSGAKTGSLDVVINVGGVAANATKLVVARAN